MSEVICEGECKTCTQNKECLIQLPYSPGLQTTQDLIQTTRKSLQQLEDDLKLLNDNPTLAINILDSELVEQIIRLTIQLKHSEDEHEKQRLQRKITIKSKMYNRECVKYLYNEKYKLEDQLRQLRREEHRKIKILKKRSK